MQAKQNIAAGQHLFYLDSEQYLASFVNFSIDLKEMLSFKKALTEQLGLGQALSWALGIQRWWKLYTCPPGGQPRGPQTRRQTCNPVYEIQGWS